MNTAQQWCYPALGSGVNPDDPAYWEARLSEEGLSMGRGTFGSRLSYGARYFDTVKVHDYQSAAHNQPQKNKGAELAKKIMKLQASGMSLRGAARHLDIEPGNACRSVKRYKANFECYPAVESDEDSNVD